MLRRSLVAIAVVFALGIRNAAANPRPLPYTYPSEMLQQGGFEIEQSVDFTPVPAPSETGAPTTLLQGTLITELEYGLLDNLELGLYFQFSDNAAYSTGTPEVPVQFDGIKQRLRWGLARPGEWPIDVELYGEVAEFQNELELEGKVILQRRFGHVRLMLNLWAEREFYFIGNQEWVLNPTGGVAWEVKPWINLGIEYWMHAELGATQAVAGITPFNQAAHSYIGPAIMMQFHHLWWSVAPYVRLDNIGRAAQEGDQYGEFWIRTVIGIDMG